MSIDRETKYDRQLRLWETSGQQKLEDSHVCLINATSTGSELLKNLVLPGIGQFTIISDDVVSQDSLSGHFFLDEDDLGKPASTSMKNKLLELNSDVKGNVVVDDVAHIIEAESHEFWDKFNTVIVSDYISTDALNKLIDILWRKEIPLMLVNTIAFYGSLKLITPETTVVETHDPSRLYDLRIDKPWSELLNYSNSIDLDEIDDTDHAHIPYVVIFLKALKSWKDDHNDLPPQNYAEKKLFRFNYVEKLSRNILLEANFIEASQSVHRALQVTQVPTSILELFESPKIKDENINKLTPLFWILVKALKSFVASNDGQLPLPGNLPDMASDTTNYVTLQNIYYEKSLKDLNMFTENVRKILPLAGRSESDISSGLLKIFCKNTALLYVSQGSKKIYGSNSLDHILEGKGSETDDETYNILSIYFAILTFNLYIDKFKTYPNIHDLDSFTNLFIEHFTPHILSGNIPSSTISTFKEVLCHNSTTYHNTSSLLGGITSQEVLKILTAQYIPLDNLFVFDGIRSISEKWKV